MPGEVDHVGRTDEYLFYVMDPADAVDGSKASDAPVAHQIVELKIVIPERPDSSTRALYEQLDKQSSHNPRQSMGV